MRRSSLPTIASSRIVSSFVPGSLASLALATVAFAQPDPDPDPPIPLPPTVVQLPTFGVAVDADGTLRKTVYEDPTGALAAARASAAAKRLPGDLAKPTAVRVVSLRRLNEKLAGVEADGSEIDDAALHLAGLQSIRYLFVIEKTDDSPGDVLICGPAEGWFKDLSGRSVGLTSRAPTLLLEDLATALAAYPAEGEAASFVGCTIDPRIEGLNRLQRFQRSMPRAIPESQRSAAAQALQRGVAESLGLADIRTFGVEPTTHLAQTLVEADYRMKSIGVGLEPPPVRMTTYAALLGGPDPGLVRWWFEPDYERLRVDEAKLSLEAVGAGLKLSAEDKQIASDGTLVSSPNEPSAAATRYADAFTKNYASVAQASPVYAELRNAVELLVAAAFLARFDGYAKSDEEFDAIVAAGATLNEKHVAPTQVPCVANAFWKGARLIMPAGGGVSIEPLKALEQENVALFENAHAARARVVESTPEDAWWWNAGP